MKTTQFKPGMKLQVIVNGVIFDGVIVSFGIHKDRFVIDLDCNRFVYLNQVIGVYSY